MRKTGKPVFFNFFFSYWNVIPDELFWANIRKAATKAFAVNIGCNVIGFFWLYIRAVKYSAPIQDIIPGEMVTVPGITLEQFMLATLILVFGFIITMCTFFISLMYYRRREKKYTEAEEC